jgi:peptide/nickel transport system substrate-binding protein
MNSLRLLSRYGGATAVAVAVIAATATLGSVSSAAAKDTLVIAIPGLPQGVDLDKHVSPQTWTMAAQLHASGLEWQLGPYPFGTGAFYDPNNLPGYAYPVGYTNQYTEPGIMDACDSSADGKVMTYHIRPGVISAAGNEFTADDVIWRIDRERKRPIIYALISKLFNLDKAKFEKVDKYTVKITNDTPAPLTCPGLTNFYYPWPDSKAIEAHSTKEDPMGDAWIATNAGGFGAYSVTEWTPGKRAVMEANPHFFRGAPKIKKIIWQVVPESSGRLALLEQGKVDIAEELSPDEILALKDSKVARGVAIRGNRQMWLILNNKEKPFNDVRVRQAINYSIPRDEIVKNVYHGMAKAWSGVISDVTPGYVNAKPYDFDPAKAKKLLTEAGYADGFETDLVFSGGVPEMENLAVILQSSLAKLNIKLNLKKLPVAAHADTVMSHKSTMALWIDSPIQPDANYVIGLMYSSGPLALVNYSNFADPQVDKMEDEGATIADPQKRIDFHKVVQQRIQEEAAFGWSVEPYYRIGIAKNLEGFHWYTTQYYEVYQMSFKE